MYQSETVGIELHRERFEEARATLEELAKKGSILFSAAGVQLPHGRLEDALAEYGFQKVTLSEGEPPSEPIVYLRNNKKGVEILADRDLGYDLWPDGPFSKNLKFHLYRIPTEKDVNMWYKEIHLTEKVDRAEKKALVVGVMFVAVVGVSVLRTPHSNSYSYEAILRVTSVALISYLAAKLINTHLEKQTLAKGPDALRHIANNTKYEAPQWRVKVPVVDAEFTDKKAEEEHQATLEALAEEPQTRARK
ncbi:MAG: hypothetical protein Q7S55_01900 [Nanoarchaeota archaeon]|nr:hypothetical protein [Nanoarchaeota archaeon]